MENLSCFSLTTDTALPRDETGYTRVAQMQTYPNSSIQFSSNHFEHLDPSCNQVCVLFTH